jgi:hypothetical protein
LSVFQELLQSVSKYRYVLNGVENTPSVPVSLLATTPRPRPDYGSQRPLLADLAFLNQFNTFPSSSSSSSSSPSSSRQKTKSRPNFFTTFKAVPPHRSQIVPLTSSVTVRGEEPRIKFDDERSKNDSKMKKKRNPSPALSFRDEISQILLIKPAITSPDT